MTGYFCRVQILRNFGSSIKIAKIKTVKIFVYHLTLSELFYITKMIMLKNLIDLFLTKLPKFSPIKITHYTVLNMFADVKKYISVY